MTKNSCIGQILLQGTLAIFLEIGIMNYEPIFKTPFHLKF